MPRLLAFCKLINCLSVELDPAAKKAILEEPTHPEEAFTDLQGCWEVAAYVFIQAVDAIKLCVSNA